MPTGAMKVAGGGVSETLVLGLRQRHTFVFFLGQHENGKDELSRKNSFDEDTLRKTGALTQRRSHIEFRREQDAD